MDLAIYVFLFVESPQLLASTLKEQVLFLKIEKKFTTWESFIKSKFVA